VFSLVSTTQAKEVNLLVLGGISLLVGLGLNYLLQNKKSIKSVPETSKPKLEKENSILQVRKMTFKSPRSPRRQHSQNSI